jgi:hypothetical protein
MTPTRRRQADLEEAQGAIERTPVSHRKQHDSQQGSKSRTDLSGEKKVYRNPSKKNRKKRMRRAGPRADEPAENADIGLIPAVEEAGAGSSEECEHVGL